MTPPTAHPEHGSTPSSDAPGSVAGGSAIASRPLPPVELLASTPTGVISDDEREVVRIHELDADLDTRETVRIRVPRPDGGVQEWVHVDVYPADAAGAGPSRGIVAFVGGLSAHALLYAGFLRELSGRGWDVVAFDVRGHGRSSGKRGQFSLTGMVEDFSLAIAYGKQRFGDELPVYSMGSSLGGFYSQVASNAIPQVDAAVCHSMLLPEHPVTVKDKRMRPVAKALAKVAPRMRLHTKSIAKWEAVCDTEELRQKLYDDPMYVWKYESQALVGFLTYAPELPLTQLRCPTLLLIGERDGMTPTAYTQQVFGLLQGDKEMVVIPDAGHMGGLVEHRGEVVDAVDRWLGARAGDAGRAPAAAN